MDRSELLDLSQHLTLERGVSFVTLSLGFLVSNMALQYGASHLNAHASALIMLSEIVFASVSSVALGGFLRFFKRYRPFIPIVERAAGALLIVVGALVVTNYYVVLNAWALSLTPDWLLQRL